MPPKAKFLKEEIVEAALFIVRTEGLSALTARALGVKLGSSARPIFTIFQNMEEVQVAVIGAARTIYNGYVEKGMLEQLAFKGVGTQYILFSVKEPKLFQLLFMSEQKEMPTLSNVLPLIEDNYERIQASICTEYGVSEQVAQRLYHHLWIYTHGIATLCATKTCFFTGTEISSMLTEVCKGLLNTKD